MSRADSGWTLPATRPSISGEVVANLDPEQYRGSIAESEQQRALLDHLPHREVDLDGLRAYFRKRAGEAI